MHAQGFVHWSTYARNIVMQPGPLTRHPSLRSLMTPSFRLIDFGRTKSLQILMASELEQSKGLGLSKEETEQRMDKVRLGWGRDRAVEEPSIEKELLTGHHELLK
jgi:hypothetical protein